MTASFRNVDAFCILTISILFISNRRKINIFAIDIELVWNNTEGHIRRPFVANTSNQRYFSLPVKLTKMF